MHPLPHNFSLQHPLVSWGNSTGKPSIFPGSEPSLRLFWGQNQQNRQNTGYFAGMYVTVETTRFGEVASGRTFRRSWRSWRSWSGESNARADSIDTWKVEIHIRYIAVSTHISAGEEEIAPTAWSRTTLPSRLSRTQRDIAHRFLHRFSKITMSAQRVWRDTHRKRATQT